MLWSCYGVVMEFVCWPIKEPDRWVKQEKLENTKVILNMRLPRVLVWRKKWLYSLYLFCLSPVFGAFLILNQSLPLGPVLPDSWGKRALQSSHMFLQTVGVKLPPIFFSKAWGTTAPPSEALAKSISICPVHHKCQGTKVSNPSQVYCPSPVSLQVLNELSQWLCQVPV